MSDATVKAAEAAAKIVALQNEIADLEKSANDHELEARAARKLREQKKKECSEWAVALRDLNVRKAVESAQAAAEKSQASAEANEKKSADVLAEVEKMKAELAELIAKARKPE